MNLPILLPSPLARGDRVTIIAASGPVDPYRVRSGAVTLEQLGLQVRCSEQAFARHGYLAGPDHVRLAQLNWALRGDSSQGIIFARGGYGVMRLLSDIDYEAIARLPKLMLGMSDLTAFQLAVFRRCGLVTFAGPMPGGQAGGSLDPLSADFFREGLMGRLSNRELFAGYRDRLRVIQPGTVSGPLLGGCLSLVVSLLGTDFLPDLSGAVLFLEEVNEPLYRIDRMMTQLKLAGVFDRVGGLILGHFTGPRGFPYTTEPADIVCDLLRRDSVPVVADFPHGHALPNVTLPHGAPVTFCTEPLSLRVSLPASLSA